MNSSLLFVKSILIIGVPAGIIVTMIAIVQSPAFQSFPKSLSIGITLDFLLIMPLLYFLLVRKTKIPTVTVVPVFILAIILPRPHQGTLEIFKAFVLPLVELVVIIKMILKIRPFGRSFHSTASLDFYDSLGEACSTTFPRIVAITITTEASIFYYGLINWRKPLLKPNQFTYDQNSGTQALIFALILIVLTELFAIHLLLVGWSPILAWVLTGFSLYSGP